MKGLGKMEGGRRDDGKGTGWLRMKRCGAAASKVGVQNDEQCAGRAKGG